MRRSGKVWAEEASKCKCTSLERESRCTGSPGQAVGHEGWGRAEARCRGVLLAVVRSLGFIGNAVGEARGCKTGSIRSSSRAREHCGCWGEDSRSQAPEGAQGRGWILLSGLHRGQDAKGTRAAGASGQRHLSPVSLFTGHVPNRQVYGNQVGPWLPGMGKGLAAAEQEVRADGNVLKSIVRKAAPLC